MSRRRRISRPTTTFTARSPVDLVAVTPHVLGFHPRDSVVMLTFGARGAGDRRAHPMHARVELPTDPDHWRPVADMLAEALLRNRPRQAAVLVYSDDHDVAHGQASVLLDRIRDEVDVVEVLRVSDGRWFALLDDDRIGVGFDLSSHPFTAEQVLAGEAPAADRAELAASLASLPEPTARVSSAVATMRSLRPFPSDRRAEALWVRDLVRSHAGRRRPEDPDDHTPIVPSVSELARLLIALDDVDVRDVAWAEVSHESARDHREFWGEVVRRAPDGLVAPAAGLVGLASWIAGHGALAWCAVDRMEADRPGYSLTRLLSDLLEAAVSPDVWDPSLITSSLRLDPDARSA